MNGARWPARYEVQVDSVLDGRWSQWFEGLIENQGGETILSGTLPDQSALHGILDKVRDLGLSIIAVRRLPPQRRWGAVTKRIRIQRPTNSGNVNGSKSLLFPGHETPTSFEPRRPIALTAGGAIVGRVVVRRPNEGSI